MLNHLPAGSDIRFHFDTSAYLDENIDGANISGYKNRSRVVVHDNSLDLFSDGRHVISFFHGENNPPAELNEHYRRGGYIHPVKTPSGIVLSSHLDPERQPHHSGMWSAWTNISYQGRTPDFWNVDQGTGRVDFEELVSRFPQTVRIDPKEPIFNYAPTQLGVMEILPGSLYTSRFEVLLTTVNRMPGSSNGCGPTMQLR